MNLLSFFQRQEAIFHSEINGKIKVSEFLGKKTLYVNGVSQSGGEYIYMWRKIISKVKSQKSKVEKCLILGVGGGTVIKYLKKNFPDVSIIGVEIDPMMIEISKKYFDLIVDSTISIEITDAYSWIEKQIQFGIYDLIIVDMYLGRFNPPFSRRREFIFKLKKLLTTTGIAIYNTHYDPKKPDEYASFLKTCKQIFRHAEEIFSYKYNRVIILQ